MEGPTVGSNVNGPSVGLLDGLDMDGLLVGVTDGCDDDGCIVGRTVGMCVGDMEG